MRSVWRLKKSSVAKERAVRTLRVFTTPRRARRVRLCLGAASGAASGVRLLADRTCEARREQEQAE
jgi:hypothetical protein